MAVRDDIVTALTGVAGINLSAYYRQSLKPFDGFVRLGTTTRASNRVGFIDTFEVWLALPQDVATSEAWLEEHRAEVLSALDPVIYVTSVTPSDLVLGANTANGVIFTGSSPA